MQSIHSSARRISGTRSRAASKIQKMVRKKLLRSKKNRISQPLARRTHHFTERVVEEYNLVVNGAGLFLSFAFQDVYNTVSYQKLFEYYKINKVIITLRYKAALTSHQDSVTATTQSVNEANPVIWFKVDHNDINPDALSVLKMSTRTKEIQFTNNRPKIDIVLKPAVLNEAYKSSIASTYVPKWGQLLTMSDPSVPHYGIKMYATGPAAASSSSYGAIEVTRQYYFSCKNNE